MSISPKEVETNDILVMDRSLLYFKI